jgi:hypothetical protein
VSLVYLIIRNLGIAQFIRRFPLLFEKIHMARYYAGYVA